jgi:alpha-D-ribose 1-methylphosphonate 5-triphosphate synthase subunit PhnG
VPDTFDPTSVLSQAPAPAIKRLAESLLQTFGHVTVLTNRTGIVMLPATDTVHGTIFHIGEVLMAEAHIRLDDHGVDGYGACLGRDLQQALAIALFDAALRAGVQRNAILGFVDSTRADLEAQASALALKVESTRVEMETF